jgi:TfoX/Sxy family transcriptional regulator of competence genes
MSYDEQLAQRVRLLLRDDPRIEERAMFGGLAFLVDGRMCCGIVKEDLVARVGAAQYEAALEQDGVRPMDFTGRPMNGYVYVGPEGYRTARLLERWVHAALDFVVTLPRKAPKNASSKQPSRNGKCTNSTRAVTSA